MQDIATSEKSEQASLFEDAAGGAASNRLALFEDCAAAIDQLFAQALETQGKGAFDEFLGFMKRFSNLSVYNAMLVRVQRPGAAAVGSRRQWAGYGRIVKPDAVPIVVLQPFGPVRFLFEIGDTEGREVPGERMSTLFAEGHVPAAQYKRTREAAVKYGIEVVETDSYGALLAGTAAAIGRLPETLQPRTMEAARYRIRLNAKHDLPTRFATLAHELGHVYCGHLGGDQKGRWPARQGLSHAQRELEAEAVAWLVCQRTGVSPRSKEYLSGLATEEAIAGVSAYVIFDAVNRVESRIAPKK
ncbi:MAG: ImmA/IrrE family metallo-endopeptidase [Candidatus Desulfobacillus denitrificans]|nr:hypothetical protein [Bacteroidia bacterium]